MIESMLAERNEKVECFMMRSVEVVGRKVVEGKLLKVVRFLSLEQ